MHLAVIAIGWSLYFALHSVLADLRVKAWAQAHFPTRFKYYRLLYVFLAVALLMPLLFLHLEITHLSLLTLPGWTQWLAGALVLLGLGIVLAAFKNYRTTEFLGIDQLHANGQPEHLELNTNGWNGIVRHPLYFGTLVVVLGVLLASVTLENALVAAITMLYLVVGARLEEAKLVQAFGDEYRTYQQRVPMLIPYLF